MSWQYIFTYLVASNFPNTEYMSSCERHQTGNRAIKWSHGVYGVHGIKVHKRCKVSR